MIGKKYVMSDLHGVYDKFIEMLEKINFSKEDKLYILGDVVDRGEHSIKILQYIMKSDNIELILGNHEDMFISYLDATKKSQVDMISTEMLWCQNGGRKTLLEFNALSDREKEEIELFLHSLPAYKIVGKYILTHSGLENLCDRSGTIEDYLSSQEKSDFLWNREEFYKKPAIKGYIFVFGHTPTKYLYYECDRKRVDELKIWHDKKHKDKIGIDCGAVFKSEKGSHLACLCLDDLEEFYI